MTIAASPIPARVPVRRFASADARSRASQTRARGVRPMRLIQGVVVLLLVSNLGRLPALWLLGYELPVLPQELVLVAALGLSALVCLQARRLRLDAVVGAAVVFALIGAGSAIATAVRLRLELSELAYSLAYLLRWVTYMGLYVAIINIGRTEDAERLWATLERTIIAFAAFGVVQAIAIPGFAQRVYPTGSETLGWDEQGHRLVSTVLDPNFAGAMILLPLLVQLGRMAFGVRVPLWKPLLLTGALLLTASRSSILALAVGGLVILTVRGLRRRVARFGAIALALLLPFTPLLVQFGQTYEKFGVNDGSALSRLVTWLRALTVLADHPVFGVGFNTYGFVQESYGWDRLGRDGFGLDGGLLFIAVLTGGVGLSVFLLMLAAVVRRCRRLWRDGDADPVARGTALGAAAGVPALCAHSLFTNSLLLPWVVEITAVLWAIVFLLGHAPTGSTADRAAT